MNLAAADRPGTGARWLLLSLLLSLAAGCGGGGGGGSEPPASDNPPPPAGPDLTGTWTVSTSLTGTGDFKSLEGVGVLNISVANNVVRGNWRTSETLIANSGHQPLANHHIIAAITTTQTGMQFSSVAGHYDMRCLYAATYSGNPVSSMSGTVNCANYGLSGTWSAVRGAPVADAMPAINSFDSADFSTCAVASDGTAWCWGKNALAELGSGDLLPRVTPALSLPGYAFTKVSVSTGGAHACGISAEGGAYCWGNQEGGRLGDGVVGPRWQYVTTPRAVDGGMTYIDIAAGGDHVCAIASDNSAWCWGHNDSGQLGSGDLADSATPRAVAGGLKFQSITAHQMRTCAVATSGAGYCWGAGFSGELGNGTLGSSDVPVPVSGGLQFVQLQTGFWSTCGVAASGDGYCWGWNGSGELGIGADSLEEPLPRQVVGGLAWKMISPGIAVTCGVTRSGGGYCWGGNLSGERGDGTFPAADRPQPGPVSGDVVFDSIDTDWHSCGLSTGGQLYCWGPGDYGSLGDGTLNSQGVPTPVSGS